MDISPKDLARRWYEEVWNGRRFEIAKELTAETGIAHLEGGEDARGIAAIRTFYDRMLTAFPDVRIDIEDIVSEGSKVVVRWRARGTHKGEIAGLKATGRAVDFRGMTWIETRDGRSVESWDSWNLGGLLEALKSSP